MKREGDSKSVGNVGVTFDYTGLFHSVRFYNVSTWATGTQLRGHVCDLKIEAFCGKRCRGVLFWGKRFPRRTLGLDRE